MGDSDAMVSGFTNYRTTHVSEMQLKEAAALISHLKQLDPEEKQADKMRKKMLAMAYNRAALPRNATKEQRKAVAQWLDSWCQQYGTGKKNRKLNDYTVAELPILVTQLEKVIKSLLIKL